MPFWRLFYHFVWTTKGREPLIAPDFEDRLHRAIAAKVVQMGGIAHAVGGTSDHIHLVASVPPQLALARFIGEVKGNSSHFVNYVICTDCEFAWQKEYGVISFGERQLDWVVRYVQNQALHHAQGTTVPHLECATESGGK
jgi:putative transposase